MCRAQITRDLARYMREITEAGKATVGRYLVSHTIERYAMYSIYDGDDNDRMKKDKALELTACPVRQLRPFREWEIGRVRPHRPPHLHLQARIAISSPLF